MQGTGNQRTPRDQNNSAGVSEGNGSKRARLILVVSRLRDVEDGEISKDGSWRWKFGSVD